MKKSALATAAIAATLLMTGCSGGSGDTGGQADADGSAAGAPEVTELTVGVVPVADAMAAYIALDEGYFEEEGLVVKMESMQNLAAIVPGVLNGQVQFGMGAISPIISAVAEEMPLVVAANAANVPEDPADDPTALLVRADSGIETPKDLEGKIVAVNALRAAVELVVSQTIANDGGDPAKVTYVAMAFPDMAAALERGDIDAAGVVEPFIATGLDAGFVSIASPFAEALTPGQSHAVYFTSRQFVQEAPNTVAAFDRAIQRAAEKATADPAVVRAALVKYGNLSAELAEKINLPVYGTEVTLASVEKYIEVMEAQGFIAAGSVNASDLFAR